MTKVHRELPAKPIYGREGALLQVYHSSGGPRTITGCLSRDSTASESNPFTYNQKKQKGTARERHVPTKRQQETKEQQSHLGNQHKGTYQNSERGVTVRQTMKTERRGPLRIMGRETASQRHAIVRHRRGGGRGRGREAIYAMRGIVLL